jgi:hypothetical protein
VSVSFYEGFDWHLLPRGVSERTSHVQIRLGGAMDGFFYRSGEGLTFVWGDFGSGCCESAPVTRPSSNVLSVVIDPCSYVWGEGIDKAQAESAWHRRMVDFSGEVALDHPDCD